MLVGVQSRANGGLSQQIGDGYLAAVVSFGSGLLLLSILTLCSPAARAGLGRLREEVRSGGYPVWGLLGGTCGAFFVLSQGLVASVIGLALFTVGIVAGQVLGGLVMDRIGLGPGGRVNPTPQRIVGTVLAVVAVAIAVSADIGGGNAVWLAVVPLVAGVGMAWQSAVNGLVRAAARSAIAATFVNFVVGTALLAVLAGVSIAIRGWPAAWPASPWLYIGGLLGVLFIALATILVRTAGVLLLSMSNVAGQLIAAVLLEAGLPLAGGVTVGLLIGAAVALAAVVIAAIPGRPSPRRPSSE
ncbi:DMT family transporter [Leucobacter sp. CSA1]|uniref:DMT family transporter n=2 Tax=Leucobacter chromiisoli TaxID=2796471 RepID=A0A934UTU5_9MICO|nr:DMT family transporter [Leucobacter chromiisoli]